eukprot:g68179.t1
MPFFGVSLMTMADGVIALCYFFVPLAFLLQVRHLLRRKDIELPNARLLYFVLPSSSSLCADTQPLQEAALGWLTLLQALACMAVTCVVISAKPQMIVHRFLKCQDVRVMKSSEQKQALIDLLEKFFETGGRGPHHRPANGWLARTLHPRRQVTKRARLGA